VYQYKRLLVALHGSEDDASAVRYAGLVSRMARSEAVYFVHIVSSQEIPRHLLKKYPEMAGPIDQFVRNRIDQMVADFFDGSPETRVFKDVMEGSEIPELLRVIRREDIDLVLVARKADSRKRGLLAEKLARKAPCSVFIVPAGFLPDIQNILVPLDFSDHSHDALEVALAFARAGGLSEITCLHVYSLPIPARAMDMRYEEMAESFKEWAQDHYEKFIVDLDLTGVTLLPHYILDADIAGTIIREVEERKVDLLVMGTRGRGAITVLLGSVTEQVIWNAGVPLIAVKKKGTGMGLLEYLFKAYYEYNK
jgi:nucleotide-binding universal stress UspA family protein